MSGAGLALLAAAAGVGFGHAILPDHWLPLAVVGRARRYRLVRVARLSGLAGVTHVLVSLVLGAIVIVVGIQFRATIEHAQDVVIGSLLLATAVGFGALQLTGRGHRHSHESGHRHSHDGGDQRGHGSGGHDHHHTHDGHRHTGGLASSAAAIVVPFGAAASPDLTILPVFLAASSRGFGIAVGSLAVFAAVTIGTIVALTVGATRGGYEIRGQWLERWGNAFTALVLAIIGALVLTSVI